MKRLPLLLAALLLAVSARTESTRFWEQTAYQSLAKGTLEGLSLRSDGSLSLGPRLDLIKETDSAYLWEIVADTHKNLYAAGGSPGRVYKITPDGKSSVFFETTEMEIHSLAIDRQGRLYAAASPDGAIYRITPDGKSAVFYHPQAKYIWALAFDSKNNLYVATGDKGKIFRVSPAGEGSVFFSSEETHVRSLIIDGKDQLFAGTDGNGLILRIQPDGSAFVLYESPKKEVTALALDQDGTLYAAAVGDKSVAAQPPTPPAPVPGQTVKSPPSVFTLNLAGGSEVYRITPDGSPQRLWNSRTDIIYSLALDAQGKLLAGTGNDGKIYAIEPGGLYTSLARSPSSQVTAMAAASDGGVLVATSNLGRLYHMGPGLAAEGSFVSDVFDAGKTSLWGRLQSRRELPPNTIMRFETRSGNTSNALLNWSPWKEARLDGAEASSQSPRARFFQWKVVLKATSGDRTPELSSVRAAYLPNNVAPMIEDMQNTPQGYRFQASPFIPQSPSKSLSLPALGTAPAVPAPPVHIPAAASMTAEKGYIGVRWFAYDDNDDTLTYSVYVRGEAEKDWKLLKDNIADMYYSWDSTNWPDGTYVAKVVASDAPSNPASEALSASRQGSPFDIDNTPPEIRDLKSVPDGKRLKTSFSASDRMNSIQSAEYSIDGSEWKAALPVSRVSDSRELVYEFLSGDLGAGEHTVVVRATDRVQNVAVAKTVVNTR